MTIEKIVMMEGRQFGLNNQMRLLGKNPKVYNSRTLKNLSKIKQKDYSPDLWFIEGTNKQAYPFIEPSQNPIVVSAHFDRGYFHYSCMGESDSDPQYIAMATNLENVDRLAEGILEKGGEDILIGTLVNPRKTIDFTLNNRQNLEQQIKDILTMPKEAQEKVIRELLEYKMGGEK